MPARTERRWLAALALALVGACKAPATGATAAHEPVADDLDAIAQALADNEAELSAAGIVVVARNEPPPVVESPSKAEDSGEAPGGPAQEEPVADEEQPRLSGAEPKTPAPAPTAAPADERVTTEAAHRERRRPRRFERHRADDTPPRCERLCGLAETTCELRDRVCSLAERHPDDVRYDVSCRRAGDQCDAASAHCMACEG